ncbi:TetR/AcrR family transcriptional regulator, partial [Serratia liquefaciens]
MKIRTGGVLQMTLAMVISGTVGWPVMLLGQPPATVVFWRCAFGTKGTEKREHLLDTALNLFARQGIADTSLNAIAREAGVTPAMLHYYFHNREQLLDVLIEERFLPVRLAAGSVFDANADDPIAAFTQLAQRFIDIS